MQAYQHGPAHLRVLGKRRALLGLLGLACAQKALSAARKQSTKATERPAKRARIERRACGGAGHGACDLRVRRGTGLAGLRLGGDLIHPRHLGREIGATEIGVARLTHLNAGGQCRALRQSLTGDDY